MIHLPPIKGKYIFIGNNTKRQKQKLTHTPISEGRSFPLKLSYNRKREILAKYTIKKEATTVHNVYYHGGLLFPGIEYTRFLFVFLCECVCVCVCTRFLNEILVYLRFVAFTFNRQLQFGLFK